MIACGYWALVQAAFGGLFIGAGLVGLLFGLLDKRSQA